MLVDSGHRVGDCFGSRADVLLLDAALLIVCILFFAANEIWVKQEWNLTFFQCYFNDVLAGIAISAYIKICFALFRKPCDSSFIVVAVSFIGIYWEYAAPLYIETSVTDNRDILCYLLGSMINIFLNKILRRRGNMVCGKCGTEMTGDICPECSGKVEIEKTGGDDFSTNGIQMTSPAPLDDGLRKFNVLYAVAAVAGVFLGFGGGFVGILAGMAFLLLFALFIKHTLAKDKLCKIQQTEFALPNGARTEDIVGQVTVPLTSMGMFVEKNMFGEPVILHNNIKYMIDVHEENHTFSIEHSIKIFRSKGIRGYRKVVASMGLIAYTVQQELLKNV